MARGGVFFAVKSSFFAQFIKDGKGAKCKAGGVSSIVERKVGKINVEPASACSVEGDKQVRPAIGHGDSCKSDFFESAHDGVASLEDAVCAVGV